MSLLIMPELVMNKIMDNLDIRSILLLRKTCHDFRNFIDDSQIDLNIDNVYVMWLGDYICLRFSYSETILIDYRETPNGCLVSHKENQKTIENVDYLEIFQNDLKIILNLQKSNLNRFTVDTDVEEEDTSQPMIDNLEICLKSKNVKAKEIRFNGDVNKILKLLPHFNANCLKKVILTANCIDDEKCDVILSDEIKNSDQWNQAEELRTCGVSIIGQIRDFPRMDIRLKKLGDNGLNFWKEKCFNSSTFQKCRLNFDEMSEIREQIIDVFGQPIREDIEKEEWLCHDPKCDFHYYIFLGWSHFQISRISDPAPPILKIQ